MGSNADFAGTVNSPDLQKAKNATMETAHNILVSHEIPSDFQTDFSFRRIDGVIGR